MVVKNISNILFPTASGKARYCFSRGFGIYCEGKGWFSLDGHKPYVLDRKYIMQVVLDDGGIVTDSSAFIPAL